MTNLETWVNKLFSAGISGTYRANLQIENNGAVAKNTVQDVYGVSSFAQYRLSFIKPGNKWLGGFFAHAEFEYMSTRPQGPKTKTRTATAPVEEPARTWHPCLPAREPSAQWQAGRFARRHRQADAAVQSPERSDHFYL